MTNDLLIYSNKLIVTNGFFPNGGFFLNFSLLIYVTKTIDKLNTLLNYKF